MGINKSACGCWILIVNKLSVVRLILISLLLPEHDAIIMIVARRKKWNRVFIVVLGIEMISKLIKNRETK